MKSKKTEVKEKILQTVIEMLNDETDLEDITVRNIAEKADVNSALINYHFQSKDNLINQAVEICMSNFADQIQQDDDNQNSPAERLRKMMISIADFSYQTKYLSQIAINSDLSQGSIHTGQILQPVMRQIYPGKTELELKIISMQIIIPIQVLFINTDKYNQYFYMQLENKAERDTVINQIINNVLNSIN